MNEEDPILDGFPISQLRVVDLKDHLEKRGLDKKGNKKELADRLKEYVLQNELKSERVPANGDNKSPEKSPNKTSVSPEKENPVIAMYKARQQQMLAEAEAEKRKSLETKQSDDEATDEKSNVKEVAAEKEVAVENKLEKEDLTDDRNEKETAPQKEEAPRGRRSTSRTRKASESSMQSPGRRSSRRGKAVDEPDSRASQKVLQLEEEDEQMSSKPSPPRIENSPKESTEEKPVSDITSGATESTQPHSTHESPSHTNQKNESIVKPMEEAPAAEKAREEQVTSWKNDHKSPTPVRDNSPNQRHSPSPVRPDPIKTEASEDHHDRNKGDQKKRRLDAQQGEEDLDYGDDYEDDDESQKNRGDHEQVVKKEQLVENETQRDEKMDVDAERIWLPESIGVKRVKEPSPCRYPPSTYIHIRGLTRPFTQNQLNDLISRNGKIRDFWIDKIKSNCIVQMSSLEEARHVRRALHNVVWPETNPKSLSVQFTTKDQFARYANGEQPLSIKSENRANSAASRHESTESIPRSITLPGGRQNLRITVETNVRDNDKLAVRHVERAREKEKEREKEIREKNGSSSNKRGRSETPPFSRSIELKRDRKDDHGRDRDRNTGRRDRSRSREHVRSGSHDHSREVKETKPKALEELFKKTTAQPSIYYLPLTEEEAVRRAEQKAANEKARIEERERREKERKESATLKRRSRSRSRSQDRRR